MVVLKSIAMSLLSALMTESFIKEMVIYLLRWLAKKSSNTIDDKIVEMIERALSGEKPKLEESKEEPKDEQ